MKGKGVTVRISSSFAVFFVAGVVMLGLLPVQGQDDDFPANVGVGTIAPQMPGGEQPRPVQRAAAQPAARPDANVAAAPRPPQSGSTSLTTGEATDVNAATAPAREPNWVDALVRGIEGLERGAGNSSQQWENRTDNRAELAKAVQSQVAAELLFLQEVAAREGATRTVKAIELLMASREKRANALVTNLEEQRRTERTQERRTRTPTRSSERTDGGRTRERTSRLRERAERAPAEEPQQ